MPLAKNKGKKLEVKPIMKKIHLIGICGTAMGALAYLLKEKGYEVKGSDSGIYPPMSDFLRKHNIEIMEGYLPHHLDYDPDLVVIGNAIRRSNPEAMEVEKRGIPKMHLPKVLHDFFLRDKHSVVISGTHGKTTTTSLCGWVLHYAGLDPSILSGGIMKNFESNAKWGEGKFFVIEGDEYDSAYFDKVPKFWYYRPKTAIITSVEFDHGDIYRDIQHIKEAFSKFVSLIPKDGFLIACGDYPHIADIINKAQCQKVTYGFKEGVDFQIKEVIQKDPYTTHILVEGRGEKYSLKSPLWGRHNASNVVASMLMALHHGIFSKFQKALMEFQGVKRRQEIIYHKNGIVIIDDFAHHPTKVKETVKAIRLRFPKKRLISVYEPRTNTSRRKFFQNLYPKAFNGSDVVIVAPVYNASQIPEEERMDVTKLVEDIKKEGIEAYTFSNVDKIIDFISNIAREGDVILIMSNGGFGGIYKKLPQRLSTVKV